MGLRIDGVRVWNFTRVRPGLRAWLRDLNSAAEARHCHPWDND
ncbi:hypothetical protein BC739_007898 [Kutzneria viridogrisea]|uniref:Uncharacterized protein n=1 Tax=Kutzneria viridogrisea TaxID=47990 RepID=A0ABR6BVL3_9PSEU|nr:hypothetical protein [Kutzneria viridogrisea]